MNRYYRRIYQVVIITLVLLGSMTVYADSKVMIQGVPLINQYPELPTGCEATALTMLLQYYDLDITKEEVAKAMPKAPLPTYKNGKKYGEHPDNAFIGNPFSRSSYGVYAPVIIDMIEMYFPGRSQDLGGGSFEPIYEAIDRGEPVMIWTTIGMLEPEVGDRWITPDGENFEWIIPEHAVVVVGYDDTSIYLNDPYTGSFKKYPKQMVINRWISMGRQAVAIKGTDAYPYCEPLEQTNIMLDGITYKNLLRVDIHGKWIPATALVNMHHDTAVNYNSADGKVAIEVREDYSIHSDISRWIGTNTVGKLEAIPQDISGEYYINIELSPMDREIITYNNRGQRVDMKYKIVDGTTYVDLDWVRKFYDKDIIEVR